MKVYKFGGASVRNAEGVRNLRNIIDDEQNLFIIVSAMGKTTNALERVFEGVQRGDREKSAAEIARLREYHAAIIDDLWHGPTRLERVEALFAELDRVAAETQYRAADAELWYDTIVAFGELLSTTVVSEYLASAGVANHWVDMRRALVTAAAPQGRFGRYRRLGIPPAGRSGRCGGDDLRGTGLHRRRTRRDDYDARP